MYTLLKYSVLLLLLVSICYLTASGQTYTETGTASYYHDKFVGRKTATGEIYSQDKMTAAHKSLPLNTWVRVTNLKNDSVIVVRINDRMPLWNKRTIDLTKSGAKKLNYLHAGLTKVKIEVIPAPTVIAMRTEKILVVNELKMIPCNTLTVKQPEPALRYPHIEYITLPDKGSLLQKWWRNLFF